TVLTLIELAAVSTFRSREQASTYQTASTPPQSATIAVRFVADAHAADITEFLESYKASVVGGPRPGGFYRLSLADHAMPEEDLTKTVKRMTEEKIVEFAAVVP